MTLRELISESNKVKRQQIIIDAINQTQSPTTTKQLSQLIGLNIRTIRRIVKECEEDNIVHREMQNTPHGRYHLIYLR